jgi:hypothetical protein
MRHCFQWEDLIRYRVFPPFSFAKLTIYIIACLRQVIAFAPKVIKYKKKFLSLVVICVTNHHYFENCVDVANFLHHCVIPGNWVYINSPCALQTPPNTCQWWEIPAVMWELPAC